MKKLGIIADDFTGATDIAGFLASNGITTVQTNGVSSAKLGEGVEAIVVSLKTRSCPVQDAIDESLRALAWLKNQRCSQFYFKYCSTFDSTPHGNIGPVTDALMKALGCELTIVCPALPINGRTVYQGYLFVHDTLLHESGMRNHPVTPMHDSKLVRLLEAQASGKACEVHVDAIQKGTDHLKQELEEARIKGFSYVVVDAFEQSHLDSIALATKDLLLVTGGSGLAESMAKLAKKRQAEKKLAIAGAKPKPSKTVILAGSCSQVTNKQVNAYKQIAPSFFIDIEAYFNQGAGYVAECNSWVIDNIERANAPMVYATKPPEQVKALSARFPQLDIGLAIEEFFAELSTSLVTQGVRNFIVGGGETAGVVVKKLGIGAFFIGPQIEPGVPWVKAVDKDIFLALKSGNFGSLDFFKKAQEFFHA